MPVVHLLDLDLCDCKKLQFVISKSPSFGVDAECLFGIVLNFFHQISRFEGFGGGAKTYDPGLDLCGTAGCIALNRSSPKQFSRLEISPRPFT